MEKSITEKFINKIGKNKDFIILIGVILLAILIRFSGLNWDNLVSIHPDERMISFAGANIDFMAGKFDPDFFAYGTLPIYMIELMANIASIINSDWQSFNLFILTGRFLSAIAGVSAIVMVYLLGKKLYSKPVGIFAALLLTLTVSHIQYSHFATVDVLLSLFIMITLYFIIDIYYGNANKNTYIIVAALIGITLAIKISAGPLLIVFGICHLLNVYGKGISLRKENKSFKDQEFKDLIKFTFITPLWFIVIVLAVNFISQPFAYIRFDAFHERIMQEINLAKDASVCYTQQYVGSPFLYYYIKEIILRSMGPPLGILSLLGLFIATTATILKPSKSKHIVLLLWAVPYFISVSTFEAKFLRYLQPLLPFLCLFASYYFIKLYGYLNKNAFQRVIALILCTILVGYTLFYALAFFSIYMKPHTFISGSLWFSKNIPTSAFILSQHWDECFPLTQFGKGSEYNKKEELELYEHFGSTTEDDKKVNYLVKHLENGDYIVAQTRRLYGATANVNERYPVTTKYFDLLFTGRLGFKLIKEFNSYPSLLGVEINDDLSDESFSVYDHPKILVFKKVKNYSKQDYAKMLKSNEENSLTKNQFLTIHHSENPIIKTYSIVDEILIVIIWWLLFETLSVIGFTILFLTLKKSGASSTFLSYIVGLLVFCYIIWLLASLNFIKYSFGFILTIYLILLLVSITYFYSNREKIYEFFKTHLNIVILSKLLFLICFIGMLILRIQTPEIYWGEKPMDYGILNNLIRIDHLPPDEIWFGGKALNYYYFGHFLFATLSKLTLIPSFFVYNLALATLAALSFLSASGIIYFLTRNTLFTVLAGILTVFWANLAGVREYLFGEYPIGFDFFWATSRVIPHTINEYPLWGLLFGDLHAHTIAMSIFILLIYLGVYQYMHLITAKQINWHAYGGISFILGTLAITNTWDFPLACIILTCCIAVPILFYSANMKRNEFYSTLFKHAITLILSILISFILFLPYWLSSKSAYIASIGFISDNEIIRINDFLLVWGFFIFIFISYSTINIFQKANDLYIAGKRTYSYSLKALLFAIAILLLLFYFKNLTLAFTTVLFILGLTAFIVIIMPKSRLITGLFSLGLAMLIFTEVFFIYDHMNTIFKFFLQVWYLFTISTVFMLYEMLKEQKLLKLKDNSINKVIIKAAWIFIFVILVGLSLFTGITAIAGFNLTRRVPTPSFTINGLDYLKFKDPAEYQAIEWLKQNVKDNTIVLEAYGHSYGDYSRIVMNTGIPTLLGWEHHLTQRAIPNKAIRRRAADIESIYSSKNPILAYDLLKKYLVDYIYIGRMEAKAYDKSGFQKFDVNPDKFKLIYSNVNVKIYKVL